MHKNLYPNYQMTSATDGPVSACLEENAICFSLKCFFVHPKHLLSLKMLK